MYSELQLLDKCITTLSTLTKCSEDGVGYDDLLKSLWINSLSTRKDLSKLEQLFTEPALDNFRHCYNKEQELSQNMSLSLLVVSRPELYAYRHQLHEFLTSPNKPIEHISGVVGSMFIRKGRLCMLGLISGGPYSGKETSIDCIGLLLDKNDFLPPYIRSEVRKRDLNALIADPLGGYDVYKDQEIFDASIYSLVHKVLSLYSEDILECITTSPDIPKEYLKQLYDNINRYTRLAFLEGFTPILKYIREL